MGDIGTGRRPLPPKPLDPKTARLRAARLAHDVVKPKDRRNEHHRVFGLADEMPFGKHKGLTIGEIMDTDVGYITWLLENTDIQLSYDADAEYLARLDPRRPRGARVD